MTPAAKAARAAARAGTAEAAPPRPIVLRAFSVWHRGQLVTVPPGAVDDPALAATLRGIHDPALLEWRP